MTENADEIHNQLAMENKDKPYVDPYKNGHMKPKPKETTEDDGK